MKKIVLAMILSFCLAAGGCTRRSEASYAPACRVVTEIQIRVENAQQTGLCRYTSQNKMIKALNCLRRLDPWDLPETDPELAPGTRYSFLLLFSDGSEKTYELIGSSYFRESAGSWREISPGPALRIPLLLAAVPSDAI